MKKTFRALLGLALLSPAVSLAAPARLGPELQVNVETQGMQRTPDVAVSSDGSYLVVWISEAQDPPPAPPRGLDVIGRFYDADGAPRGDEFRVHSAPGGNQVSPRTAVDRDGNYLVLWEDDKKLYARSFRPDGSPWSTENVISPSVEPWFQGAAVAADPAGGFVVAWAEGATARSLRAVRLDGRGAYRGNQVEVRAADLTGFWPQVAVSPAGGFVVTWNEASNAKGTTIQARLFSPTDQPIGAEIQVAASDLLNQVSPLGAVPVFHSDGSFSVAWLSVTSRYEGTLYARTYEAAGTPRGAVIPLGALPGAAYYGGLDVAADAEGNLLLLWEENRDTTSGEVFGRLFDPSWQPLDDVFRVNTFNRFDQSEAAVAAGEDGRFVAVWGSGEDYPVITPTGGEGFDSPDGHFFGVFSQRFSTRCLGRPALCLAGGRFMVEVDWTAPAAGAGPGVPVRLTDDTGAFWFFGPDNLELLVKVLDGRAVNGHFWVFFGGLTDIPFTLTVTDTETGVRRTYTHPAGTLASRADTEAFAAAGAVSAAASPGREALTLADRLGVEIPINTTTLGAQSLPAVSAAPDGSFMAVWVSRATSQSPGVVYGRIFDASGTPRTAELPMAGRSLGSQDFPRVAASTSGSFLVLWSEQENLYSGLFSPSGAPLGGRILLDSGGYDAAVAAEPGGGFVAAWITANRLVRMQRLDSAGNPLGTAADVQAVPVVFRRYPQVAVSPGGGLVVTWAEWVGPSAEVWLRTYNAAGQPLHEPTRTGGAVSSAVPLFHPDGRFSILWTEENQGTWVRSFNASGAPQGPAVELPIPGDLYGLPPSVAADPSGLLLVTWQEDNPVDIGNEVYGRYFDSSWAPRSGTFRINTFTGLYQKDSVVAASGSGRFITLWSSGAELWNLPAGTPTQDGSSLGVFGQILDSRCQSASALCLNGGRFQVEAVWKTPGGQTGLARPVRLTDDTGNLWFFSDQNHELMVKVLDGRPVNGHFWVFFGALSNVEYTITVTDTVTAARKTYRNPPGGLTSRADTAAFPAAP